MNGALDLLIWFLLVGCFMVIELCLLFVLGRLLFGGFVLVFGQFSGFDCLTWKILVCCWCDGLG